MNRVWKIILAAVSWVIRTIISDKKADKDEKQ